ncbi:T4SS-associated protein LvrD [Legionella sp. km772]|uniref:T4SS-associated protein LvrD n=1 Tax=Legionella sp. km772 TaxID=2498111 RepID=UPI000F8F604D|nr:T4SS-associated protein LvrD [Legionella sp. km772]RUR10816.1 protein LvrD [Legionella sp. km772]
MNRALKQCIVLLSVLTLCACHHDNPLKTHSKQDTLNFLLNASANAEKCLHILTQKDSYGYGYLECMDGKKSPELQCTALYLGMMEFAREGHYPGFNKLRAQDLIDAAFFTTIADDYAEFAVTHEPRFVIEAH